MKPAKRTALQQAGWRVGDAKEFLASPPATFTAADIKATLLKHYKWQRAQVDDLVKTLTKDQKAARANSVD